jgi:hypothetical protein
MRRSILLSTMLCLAVAAPTFAQQTFPAKMTIVLKEAEVRSGPSKQYYVTSKLPQNETVTVLRECKDQPGWYEIEPPKGSFSWINGKFVRQVVERQGFVECTQPAPIYAGSVVNTAQPDREIMKLSNGSGLNLVGPGHPAGGETWFPIFPHPGEVRYLQVEAVKPATQIAANKVGTPDWTLSANGYTINPTLAAAENAMKANDTSRARDLFQQVASTTTILSEKIYATNRVLELSNPNRQVPATTTSLSPANPAPASTLLTLSQPAWTTYGRLRDTKLLSDNGQPLYALEVGGTTTPIWVTTTPGKSLQSYVGRVITVYGPTMYRADSNVRMPIVVVSHVAFQ